MQRGTVLWFNDITGRGVVRLHEDNSLVKVNHAAIKEQGYKILDEGQDVWLTATRKKEGLTAELVYTDRS